MTAADRTHRLFEEASDIVAIVGGVTRDRARAVLRAMSAHTRIKEQHVAELVVEWAVSGRLPADLHRELRFQLDTGPTAAAPESAGP
ncbi:hypothetical protein [Streptomyces sp. NPDC046985]|uniref:hypothetical protein n=1 Tax=Streptomyces sp. NPDC046985 TaxID=3155377 RepID=UPI0033C407D7